jgi:pimeloyl-ACP methyl ester carboxylesterase
MTFTILRGACLALAAAFLIGAAKPSLATHLGTPPAGFSSGQARVNGTSLHYIRGGHGPAVILLHGFPEDWVEYRVIMPRLAKRFTVVAVDLPGIGKSGVAAHGYDTPSLAGDIHALADSLKLERPYVVGHDLGAHVTYAYARRFPDALRGAMILDVPMPGLAGSEEAGKGFWHVGFIMEPGLAEKLVPGRQADFLGYFFNMGKFTPAERSYFTQAYGTRQLHAAFEVYRAIPRNTQFNAAQKATNPVPLTVAVGAESPFSGLLSKFVDGYRAKGMTHVEGARISGAGHYVVADNPDGVAGLIERSARAGQ